MPGTDRVSEVSYGSISAVFRKHKLCVIVTAAVVTVAFCIYALSLATTYRAEAFLAAGPMAVGSSVKAANTPLAEVNVQENLWFIREHLLSPTVLEPLIEEFHLDQNSEIPRSGMQLYVHQALAWIGGAYRSLFPSAARDKDRDLEQAIENLKKKISIHVEANDAFSIGFESNNRKDAMNVANRMSELLVRQTSAASEQSTSMTAAFLKAEADRVKQKMDEQSEAIRRYQQANANEFSNRLATDLRYMENLQDQLRAKADQISNEQARRTSSLQEIRELEQRGALSTVNPSEKSKAEQKLEELQLKLKQLRTVYKEGHPEVLATLSEIRNLEKSIAEHTDPDTKAVRDPSSAQLKYVELKAELQAIDQRLANYQKQEKELTAEVAAYKRRAEAAPESERALTEMNKNLEITRTEYQNLMQKSSQAQLDERLNRENEGAVFRIIRPARLPITPSGPHRARIALLGIFAGLGLGIGFALIAQMKHNTFDSGDEFRDVVSVPILTEIPTVETRKTKEIPQRSSLVPSNGMTQLNITKVPAKSVVTLNDPKSIVAEQYGILAIEVRHRLGRDASRVLAVTSPSGGEGKTTTCLNLSLALSKALHGEVLLVEGDLRKPRIHEYLGIRSTRGFSDLLRNPDDSIESCLVRVNGLAVIPGGPLLEDPLWYLASPRLPAVMKRLRERFKFIILDTPPLVPVADGHIMSEIADGIVLVVRAHHTRRDLLSHTLQTYRSSKLLGVVLNAVDLRQSGYAYAYEYYSEHYLGKGNGSSGKGVAA